MNFSAIGVDANVELAKNCAVFLRISSAKQTQGVSMTVQLDIIRAWATRNMINILRVFSVVGSGRNLDDDKEFKKMMRYAKSQKDNRFCIATFSVDRFGRNTIAGNAHLHSILRSGIHFCSVSEGLYVHKMHSVEAHRFTQLMQAADMESIRISERVNGANKYLKTLGWRFGRCPKGMKVEFVPVDRSTQGLPPKMVRTFVDDFDAQMENVMDHLSL